MENAIKVIGLIFAMFVTIVLIAVIVIVLDGKIQSIPNSEIKNNCKIEHQLYKERSAYLVRSISNKKYDKVIFFIHGGSYMGSLTPWYWNFICELANDTGALLIVPDYPLTPNYNYKDVFEFMEPLYEEIIKQVPKDNLILLGDSAGGGLSLALVEKMGEKQKEMPSKTVLISPWLDVRMENPKIKEIEKNDPVLNVVNLKVAGITYAGKDGLNSYLVNPIDGPLGKLENIVIYTGTNDILNPDVWVFEERARKQGVTIQVKETKGAIHDWIIELDDNVEHSKEDYENLVKELKG